MCTNPIPITLEPTFLDRLKGFTSKYVVNMPCGKCSECMKKKQNSIRFRVYNEAKKYGKCDFVTLTYDNEHLPISSSLWRVDRDNGEMSLFGECRVCNAPNYVRIHINGDYDSIKLHRMRSVVVRHAFSDIDPQYDYWLNYSPSHNYVHVKKLLKLCRTHFERKYGYRARFSFLCVPEFGEHNTRRPHFHLVFCGAQDEFVNMFSRYWYKGCFHLKKDVVDRLLPYYGELAFWPYVDKEFIRINQLTKEDYKVSFEPLGFTCWKPVMAVNEDDHSDGFAKLASYVGKYVGKGVFEDSLVKDGFVVLPRISISPHFGELPDNLVRWHLCKDVFGEYDDETLEGLSEDVLSRLTHLCASRLYNSFQGYDYALPVQFKKQIFKGRVAVSRNDVPSYLKKVAWSCDKWPDSGKVVYSALYYRVQDFIQSKFVSDSDRKFRQFVTNFPSEGYYSAVLAFENMQAFVLAAREEIACTKQQSKLQSLKF